MIAHQLGEERVALVLHQIVKANAAADEHLFDTVYLTELPQQVQVFLMADLQAGARLGRQTFFALA